MSDSNLFKWDSGRSPSGIVFVPLTSPLTSTDWDGDSFSTTAKTLIDLSAVFGVPAGVSAVLVTIGANDSGSAAAQCWFSLNPTTYDNHALLNYLQGVPDDVLRVISGIVPCDENGDVYYQCIATGAGTLDIILSIWGYWL